MVYNRCDENAHERSADCVDPVSVSICYCDIPAGMSLSAAPNRWKSKKHHSLFLLSLANGYPLEQVQPVARHVLLDSLPGDRRPIACIHQVIIRKEVFFRKRFMNRCGYLTIWHGGNRCLYVRDQMHLILFTCFCQMNLVPCPGRCPLVAIMRFWIVGGILAQTGRR